MSPSLPFLRIPKTAQLVVVTDLEQESFPVIHLKKLFPGRDFVVVSPRDFKIGDWKKADKNFEGFIYLEEKENQLFPAKQPSENKIQLLEDGFQIQTVKWQEITLILLLGGGRPRFDSCGE